MTTSHSVVSTQQKSIGDTVVDGLFAGLVGGVVMALFLVGAGWLTSTPPLTTLAYFDPAQSGSWLIGLLTHLAVSAMYGVVFGLLIGVAGRLWPSLLRWQWLGGIGYGLLLWLLGRGVMVSAVASPLVQIPAWQFAAANVLYGLLVGYRLQTSN